MNGPLGVSTSPYSFQHNAAPSLRNPQDICLSMLRATNRFSSGFWMSLRLWIERRGHWRRRGPGRQVSRSRRGRRRLGKLVSVGAVGNGQTPAKVAPAYGGSIFTEAAGVVIAGADGGKRAGRRRGLAVVVVAPAGHRAVEPDAAGVALAGADGLEAEVRRSLASASRGNPSKPRGRWSFNPQAYRSPTLTERNSPAGAVT